MISLTILCAVFLLSILVTAWVLAFSARMAGSSRGRFRTGLVAFVVIIAINVVCGFAAVLVSKMAAGPVTIISLLLLLAQLTATFFVLRRAFQLSIGRAFAPLAAYFIVSIVEIVLLLVVVRPLVLEAFVMPTESMTPTIAPGDRFVVDKLIQPRRWDLVAYWEHPNNGALPNIYCKRLIGLPGERLRFSDGTIYINDKRMIAPAVLTSRCRAYPAALPPPRARYRDDQTIALGVDEYFFIGDHADISADSRMFGPAKRSSIVGVIDLMYWPPGRARIVR